MHSLLSVDRTAISLDDLNPPDSINDLFDIFFLDANYVFLIYTGPFMAKTLQLIDFHVRFNFNSIKWRSETSFRCTSSPLSIYRVERHTHWQTIVTASSFDVSFSILNHQMRKQWNLHITNHIRTDIHWLNHANINVLHDLTIHV